MGQRTLITAAIVALTGASVLGCNDDEGLNLPQRPQIFPRLNPINICEVQVGRQAQVDLMLDNWGRERLNITGIEVHHDRRCAFASPNGDVRLYDEDESDEFAASVRSRDSAFVRIEYTPPSSGVDEISLTVHSNAENFPDLELYVCGGGASEPPLSCQIRTDPECSPSGESCSDANPCALRCFESGDVCETADDCTAPGDFCYSPHYCVLADPEDPASGTCECRPCAVPPEEDWADCEE